MSSVPKGKQKESPFAARHHFYKLRDAVTGLMLNDFGFSQEKYERNIEKYRQAHQNSSGNVDEIVARWKKKNEAFNAWFIDKECDAVLNILRKIESEFTFGNSIYPSDTPAKISEYCERRKHINAAISYCYILKQEIQYIIKTLPVDMNKFDRFDDMITQQIKLYKGVRRSDNRFLKQMKKNT